MSFLCDVALYGYGSLSCAAAEGVTHIDPKGDGVHFISNGKDQCVKLWDMRRSLNASDAQSMARDPAVPRYRWCAFPITHPSWNSQALLWSTSAEVIWVLFLPGLCLSGLHTQHFLYAAP